MFIQKQGVNVSYLRAKTKKGHCLHKQIHKAVISVISIINALCSTRDKFLFCPSHSSRY